jgi:outer membrane murein-binding lipoprotein Lpp
MMKKSFAVSAVVVMAVTLVGCGSSDKTDNGSGSSGDYCDTIQSVKDEVNSSNLETMSQADFDHFRDKIGDIEASAPADVADDWHSLGDYLGQFNSLLTDAGISLDDIQSLQGGTLPPGVDAATMTQLATKISALTTSIDVDAADKAITASAKKECGIDLDATSGTPSSDSPAS